MIPTQFFKRSSIGAIGSLMLAGLVLSGQSSPPENELHGATPMDEQRERLSDLRKDRNLTEPPENVDPVIWNEVWVPEDNRMTQARIALGEQLYFDTRLSADGTVACATCHDVNRGFTDQRMVSEGINDSLGMRNAPTTMNAVFMETQFWDGRVPDLEGQAALPPVNPIEMGHPDQDAVVASIADVPMYQKMFQEAYGSNPNFEDMIKAIAAFERTLVFLDAPFDRYLAGDEDAISEQAKRGWELFNGKARCVTCHTLNQSNPSGSDSRFHNIGVAARAQNFEALARKALDLLEKDDGVEAIDQLALQTDLSELGRFLVTKDRADIGAFKTEQLRNIALTAPYMHDGSMRTLWDVMDHYNKGGEANPFLDGGIEPLALSQEEMNAIIAFMFTLTDDRFAEENRQALREQQKIARENRPFREEDIAQREKLLFEQRVFGEEVLTGGSGQN